MTQPSFENGGGGQSNVKMVGIIGTHWGRFLGKELRSFYHGPLTICGRDLARTRKVAYELRAAEETDWHRFQDNPNVSHVIVAVPPAFNVEIVVGLLRAGKHVLVEKPLSLRLDDSDAMIAAAQEERVVLAVGENIPFRPAIQEAKKRLHQIGEPRLYVTSLFNHMKYKHPGIWLDHSVHCVRGVRELFGEPDTVFASRAKNCVDGDDNATMVLGSRAGWMAVIILSWQASVGVNPEIILTGTNGAMKIWPSSTYLDMYPLKPNKLTQMIAKIRPTPLRQLVESQETQRQRSYLPRTDRMGYRGELTDFIRMTRLGLPNVTSALEAKKDLAIVLAAQRSLTTERSTVLV